MRCQCKVPGYIKSICQKIEPDRSGTGTTINLEERFTTPLDEVSSVLREAVGCLLAV